MFTKHKEFENLQSSHILYANKMSEKEVEEIQTKDMEVEKTSTSKGGETWQIR